MEKKIRNTGSINNLKNLNRNRSHRLAASKSGCPIDKLVSGFKDGQILDRFSTL